MWLWWRLQCLNAWIVKRCKRRIKLGSEQRAKLRTTFTWIISNYLDYHFSFNWMVALLSSPFRDLQRQFHPDKFAIASGRDRLLAVQKAAQINVRIRYWRIQSAEQNTCCWFNTEKTFVANNKPCKIYVPDGANGTAWRAGKISQTDSRSWRCAICIWRQRLAKCINNN